MAETIPLDVCANLLGQTPESLAYRILQDNIPYKRVTGGGVALERVVMRSLVPAKRVVTDATPSWRNITDSRKLYFSAVGPIILYYAVSLLGLPDVATLLSRERTEDRIKDRLVVIAAARALDFSEPAIGRLIGRDHTTVHHFLHLLDSELDSAPQREVKHLANLLVNLVLQAKKERRA